MLSLITAASHQSALLSSRTLLPDVSNRVNRVLLSLIYVLNVGAKNSDGIESGEVLVYFAYNYSKEHNNLKKI